MVKLWAGLPIPLRVNSHIKVSVHPPAEKYPFGTFENPRLLVLISNITLEFQFKPLEYYQVASDGFFKDNGLLLLMGIISRSKIKPLIKLPFFL